MAQTAHFGSRQVPLDAKQDLVNNVFHSVARRYDLMNDLMSFGLHRAWQNALITAVDPPKSLPFALLDVAGGTGDIAFGWRKRGGGPAVLCDINASMLSVGRDRGIDHGQVRGLTWVNGDAEKLPFAPAQFDVYTIAFGLRNVTDIDAALREAARVLKPGGRFFCLEFSKVVVPPLARAYDAWSRFVIPALGSVVARDPLTVAPGLDPGRQQVAQVACRDLHRSVDEEGNGQRRDERGIYAARETNDCTRDTHTCDFHANEFCD